MKFHTLPKYVTLVDDFKPLPKYGHYSDKHPEYVKIEDDIKKGYAAFWDAAESWPQLRDMAGYADAAIPPGGPDREKDIVIELIKFPARDGHMVELKVYRSLKVEKPATLMYRMHGGGMVVGTHETDGAENVYAAANHNIVCVSVDYRLAPEFPFPYGINDCYDGLVWCKNNAEKLGIDPEKIIIGGSSAGAHLTAALALEARDAGLTGILGQVLHFPYTCHPKLFPKDKYEFGSYIQNSDNAVLNVLSMEGVNDLYNPEPSSDQRISPLLASTHKGLPPTLIQVGGVDILRDESLAYAEALQEAGVEVESHVFSGLPHCFPGIMVTLPETATFYERYNKFLSKHA